jgi:Ca2+:H+ antiporter
MSRTNGRIDRYQLLGDATENMSPSLGETLAGLLNASFGNAVEIIVGIAALMQGAWTLLCHWGMAFLIEF